MIQLDDVEGIWAETREVAADGYRGVLGNDPDRADGLRGGRPRGLPPRHVSHVGLEADHDWPARIEGPPHVFTT